MASKRTSLIRILVMLFLASSILMGLFSLLAFAGLIGRFLLEDLFRMLLVMAGMSLAPLLVLIIISPERIIEGKLLRRDLQP